MAGVDDADAWVRVFRETLPDLYAFVARRARGERELCEDVTQETWLRAVRAWRAQGPPDAPLAWLRTTAANLLRNHFRDRERDEARALEHGRTRGGGAGEDPGADGLVAEGLARVPAAEAALLRAFHLDGRSTRELAREHGLSERAVEGRLRRARRRLAHILGRRKP